MIAQFHIIEVNRIYCGKKESEKNEMSASAQIHRHKQVRRQKRVEYKLNWFGRT